MTIAETRLRRLAQNIDRLAEKDAESVRYAHDMIALRRAAAAELYGICAQFVADLNRVLERDEVALDPPEYGTDAFQDTAANLVQINVRGRILQVEFEVTPELVSTEDFRIPYTLQGFVRGFNQELLDKHKIEEQLIFYTLEKPRYLWRYFDARTYHSGPFDRDYLISLMEQLV